jgi:tetratricopeptide (TPR) repeat protein
MVETAASYRLVSRSTPRWNRLCLVFCCLAVVTPGFCQTEVDSLLISAREAQGRQDFAAAAEAYRAAVKVRPDTSELWANLGIIEYEAHQYEAAAKDLASAIRLDSSLYSPFLFLGLDELRLDHPKEALPYLQKAERLKASDPQPLLALGRAEVSLNDYFEATDEYRKALVLDPENSTAWFDAGMAYLSNLEKDSRTLAEITPYNGYSKALFAESLAEQHRYVEAATQYVSALGAQPQPPCLRSALGFIYLRQGKTPEAMEQFQSEKTLHPECNSTYLWMAEIDFASSRQNEGLQELEQSWHRDRGYTTSNLSSMLEMLSADQKEELANAVSARKDQADGQSRDFLDALLRQMKEKDFKAKNTVTGETATSHSRSVQRGKALAAYQNGHYRQCTSWIDLSAGQHSSAELLLAAKCSYMTGDYLTARTAAHLARAKLPADPEVLYWSIRADQRLAVEALERFQRIAPDSPQTHLLLGDMDRQRHHYDDAISEYKLALNEAPSDPAALQGLTSAYLFDDKIEDAVKTATAALSLKPSDPELNLLLGEALVTQRKYQQAEAPLENSMSGKPQLLPQAHALLGQVYAGLGRVSEAIANLKLGLDADEDGSFHYQLARLYRQTGDTAAAAASMDQAKSLAQQHRTRAIIAVQQAPQAADQ